MTSKRTNNPLAAPLIPFLLFFSLLMGGQQVQGRRIDHWEIFKGTQLYPIKIAFSQPVSVNQIQWAGKQTTGSMTLYLKVFFPEHGREIITRSDDHGIFHLDNLYFEKDIYLRFTKYIEKIDRITFYGQTHLDYKIRKAITFFKEVPQLKKFSKLCEWFTTSFHHKIRARFSGDNINTMKVKRLFDNYPILPMPAGYWPLFQAKSVKLYFHQKLFGRRFINSIAKHLKEYRTTGDIEEIAGTLLFSTLDNGKILDKKRWTEKLYTLQNSNNYSFADSTRLSAISLFALVNAGQRSDRRVIAGINFLLSRQRDNGSFKGNPYKSDEENSLWPAYFLCQLGE